MSDSWKVVETVSEENKKRHYRFKEVCVRLEEGRTLYSNQMLTSPDRAAEVMRKELSMMDREMVCVINLNSKLKPINFNVVSIGTLNAAPAEFSNMFKSAILSNASCIMVMHNHPSGNTEPSVEDIGMTKRIVAAGQLMNIKVLDHIIVGGQSGEIYSMRENCTVDFEIPDDLRKIRKILSSVGVREKESVMGAIKDSSNQRRVSGERPRDYSTER